MPNLLDENNPTVLKEGKDVNVISKQIPVTVTSFEKNIPYLIGGIGVLLAVVGIIIQQYGLVLGLILPLYVYKKMKDTSAYLSGLEQKINSFASEIDNYMEQRVVILKNAADLINKSVELDKTVFVDLAKYRSGNFNDQNRNEVDSKIGQIEKSINVALESYPQLQAHATIADGMQQNSYLQREITAARSTYNDAVYQWNREIFIFPFNKIIAAKEGRTTRIPFSISKEIKEEARGEFFK